ncbi:MAG: Formamidopyrimidine-DNA glycosylase [Alphaproteobacteria bacterium MarineAlpha3_Bin5]|nr:DNA-formamidopyrimidine glycosylase [Magnetovibrio sp.]PPR79770.1 MAG: Formamidopyrimidine-DNA glycosylase [Alphaproteobacteria bacterium MarineAlpha3_Bin5]|tara:strand:- start:63 stop:893 length:831 start_codon:yes stop_codon:yes gene_type:complete
MPELPEVETIRRILEPALTGKRITGITMNKQKLRFPFPENFKKRLTGRTIHCIQRRAKYLLFYLDTKDILVAHLGMSGSFRLMSKQDLRVNAHDHVTFMTNTDTIVHYNDPRRFGFMDLVDSRKLNCHPMLRSLGPEPLSEYFNAEILINNLAKRKGAIKPALLDQKLIAGIGNIYACEALFRARLSPRRSAYNIRGKRAEYLVEAIKNVLIEAIEAGGATLRNHQDPDGKIGYFQNKFSVYGRDGKSCENCNCNHGIRKIIQSGRPTFFCSTHQK